MVPMGDGKRMAADIYRPKDTSKKYPIIFIRTPYNFNFWDVRLRTYCDMSTELDAVKRGYVLIEMNELGHFFSEGNYDILGAPLSHANDEFNWMSSQPWSNGNVGLIGCPSTAEWQLAAASLGNKALKTIIPGSFGADVGKVGPYNEQDNWYRGGAVQMLFIDWLYGEQNQVRPMFPRAGNDPSGRLRVWRFPPPSLQYVGNKRRNRQGSSGSLCFDLANDALTIPRRTCKTPESKLTSSQRSGVNSLALSPVLASSRAMVLTSSCKSPMIAIACSGLRIVCSRVGPPLCCTYLSGSPAHLWAGIHDDCPWRKTTLIMLRIFTSVPFASLFCPRLNSASQS
jgi:hypothetical protein